MPWRPDLLTLAEGKDWLRYTKADKDGVIADLITAASSAIYSTCRRQFGRVDSTTARTYRKPALCLLDGSGYLLQVDDFHDATGLAVTADGTAVTAFTPWPDSAPDKGKPYEGLLFESRPAQPVVATHNRWGWASVPPGARHACRLQLSRWFTRIDSPYGIAGSPSEGSEVRLSARLDPDVATSLKGLRRAGRPG